jgi:hypothetical protein
MYPIPYTCIDIEFTILQEGEKNGKDDTPFQVRWYYCLKRKGTCCIQKYALSPWELSMSNLFGIKGA